ncbi:hypothetical protein B296_00053483 [Ensete ventricosum]|uniref:Uncharacterized protein n=1 Tax=Ensete ventricosum TaxID=4639 RepID=A0A426Y837_ENSVE|nr:hypothetical protein B296_00053483 [Ensete ventricosum]
MVPPSNDKAVAQLPETFAAGEPQDSAVDEENLERQRPRVAGEAAVILVESDKDAVRVLGGGRGERREREIATVDGWEAVMRLVCGRWLQDLGGEVAAEIGSSAEMESDATVAEIGYGIVAETSRIATLIPNDKNHRVLS